jgi:hypothetical protein
LYVQDYLIWVQQCSSQRISSLYKEFKKLKISKEELGWPLQKLEVQAMEKAMEMEEDDEDGKPLPLDS